MPLTRNQDGMAGRLRQTSANTSTKAIREILYPTKTRRFMTEVAGVRRYHRSAARAVVVARGGVLWIAVCKGWSCNPDRVAIYMACIERQDRRLRGSLLFEVGSVGCIYA